MRNRILLAALLLASMLCLGAYQTQPRQKWEYKSVVTNKNEPKEINELGADGWELTAVTFQPVGLGGVSTFYFKRAK